MGFEITYPDGYVTTSRDRGVTVQTLGDFQQAQAAGNPGGVPARGLDILYFDNPEGLSPLDWAQRNDGYSYWSSNQSGKYDFIQFAGQRALTFSWCNGSCGDELLFNRGDGRSLVYIDTYYTDPNDPTRGDFKRMASSIRFARNVAPPPPEPPRPPSGAIGDQVAAGSSGSSAILVTTATYGGVCGAQPGNWSGYVARECNGQARCDFVVDNRYGDPAQGCGKDFAVEWRCGSDPTPRRVGHPAQGGEHYTVALSCDAAPGPMGPAPVDTPSSQSGPAPGEVWLYEDCGFHGRVLRLNADRPSLADNFNDRLSAVRVGPGTTVTLFEHERFGGRTLTLERDEACLDNRGFNDIASSIRIRSGQAVEPASGPAPGEAWLYESCNFSGRVKRVTEDLSFLGDDFNDVVSSVRVGPDTRIVLFRDEDFRGRSVALERDEACLDNRDFSAVASSVRVKSRHSGEPENSGPAVGEVWLYEDCNFSGRVKRVTEDLSFLGDDFDDTVSSVRVGPETRVVLYKDEDFHGRSVSLDRDESCLENRHFNDVASSLRLRVRHHR
jgi:hypothetical protein